MRGIGFLAAGLTVTLFWALAGGGAATAGTKLESSVFPGAQADWPVLFAWCEQKAKLLEAISESDNPKVPSPAVVKAQAALKPFSAAIGRELPAVLLLDKDRARLEFNGKVHLVRFDEEPKHLAVLFPRTKAATLIGLPALKASYAQVKAPKYTFVSQKTDVKVEKQLFGRTCLPYEVEGDVRGRIWVAVLKDKHMRQIVDFVANARTELGGWSGELLYATVMELEGLPVLARVSGLGGPSITGEVAGNVVLSYHTLDTAEAEGAQFMVPDGYKQRRVGLPPPPK